MFVVAVVKVKQAINTSISPYERGKEKINMMEKPFVPYELNQYVKTIVTT